MKFSILTPTKNRRDFLKRAADSVLAQTHQDWEWIVIDDSDEPVEDALPDDPRIRYFRERNDGPSYAFNLALDRATGEIIHPLADDDLLSPTALESVAEKIGDHQWAYAVTLVSDELGTPKFSLGQDGFDLERLRKEFYIGGAVYWRKSLTDRLGGFDTSFDSAADYDLYLRFAENSEPLHIEEVLYLYTDHPDTDTRRRAAIQARKHATIGDKPKAPLGPRQQATPEQVAEITALIPFKRGGNKEWLDQAVASLPVGLTYLVLENDGELHEALNAGLRAAKTEYVLRLDADDVLHSDAVGYLHSLAWDVDVAYPTLHLTDEQLHPQEIQKAAAFCRNRLLDMNFVPGVALIRRHAALKVGGYREFEALEDWDLWVRMSRAGARFKAVPEAKLYYRQHPSSRNKAKVEEREALKQRLRTEIVGEREPYKATFYYQASYATTYWRCLLPARYLPGKAIDFPMVKPVEEGKSLEFPEQEGAAIWQFPGDGGRAVMMAEQQEQGIRVLVESDDNYFDLSPFGNPGWGRKVGDGSWHTMEVHQKILPWVDGIIVTNEQLAQRYRRFNKNVYVCPNQIDPQDWAADKPNDGVFRVGWFGSRTHTRDIPLVHRALEWASRQPGVEVVTMGIDPSWKFKRRHIPWTNDMSVYMRLMPSLDVGLAPVVESPWAVCRSDLKAIEYGISAVAPILSDGRVYRPYEGPCLRAKNPRDFLRHVQHLVQNRDEAKLLGLEAREYVLKHRTVEKNIWRWMEACESSSPACRGSSAAISTTG